MALQRLKEAAEKAKHELSSSLETEINLPFIAQSAKGEPLHIVRTLTRSELELLTSDLDRADARALPQGARRREAHARATSTTSILVGGMTRMPAVQKAVKQFFGKDPHKGVNPDEVVAAGAALQGAALSDDKVEVLLLDVTPLSIGVETGGGVFTTLIARNTTIPTEKSEIFTTSVDNQSFVPIHVLQGERKMAADNRSLARFELTGHPAGAARRAEDPGHVPDRRERHRERRSEGSRHGQGADGASVKPTSGLSTGGDRRARQRGRQVQIRRRAAARARRGAQPGRDAPLHDRGGARGLREPGRRRGCSTTRARSPSAFAACSTEHGDLSEIRDAYQKLEAMTFQIAEKLYGSDSPPVEG